MKADDPARYEMELAAARERQQARRHADPDRVRELERAAYWRRKANGNGGGGPGVTVEEAGRRWGMTVDGARRLLHDEQRAGRVWRDRDGRWRLVLSAFAPDLLAALAGLGPTDRDRSTDARRANGRPVPRGTGGLHVHQRRLLDVPLTNGAPPVVRP
jgi:hypothetical protein